MDNKQKALLTKEECQKIVDFVYSLEEIVPENPIESYDFVWEGAKAQLDKAWDIAKQEGFEIGLKQGLAEGKRGVIARIANGEKLLIDGRYWKWGKDAEWKEVGIGK